MRNPLQPLYLDHMGTARFKANQIVQTLLDSHRGLDLNDLARMDFSQDDREQFAQLIGYSLSGFHELSRVSDETAAQASQASIDAGLGDPGCRSHGCEMHCGVPRES